MSNNPLTEAEIEELRRLHAQANEPGHGGMMAEEVDAWRERAGAARRELDDTIDQALPRLLDQLDAQRWRQVRDNEPKHGSTVELWRKGCGGGGWVDTVTVNDGNWSNDNWHGDVPIEFGDFWRPITPPPASD